MSDLRALIDAAKADSPNAATRAKVWAGVSSVVTEAAALAGNGAVTGSAGATKFLLLGTLLGGSVTVGVAAALLFIRGATPAAGTGLAAPAPPFVLAETAPPSTIEGVSRTIVEVPSVEVPAVRDSTCASCASRVSRVSFVSAGAVGGPLRAPMAPIAPIATGPAEVARKSTAQNTAPVSAPANSDDALAREAALLAEARNAVAKRDAISALQIIRGLRALPTRQLVPEELSVEAQALRSLGLQDDAHAVDEMLRARFPDSVLGR